MSPAGQRLCCGPRSRPHEQSGLGCSPSPLPQRGAWSSGGPPRSSGPRGTLAGRLVRGHPVTGEALGVPARNRRGFPAPGRAFPGTKSKVTPRGSAERAGTWRIPCSVSRVGCDGVYTGVGLWSRWVPVTPGQCGATRFSLLGPSSPCLQTHAWVPPKPTRPGSCVFPPHPLKPGSLGCGPAVP